MVLEVSSISETGLRRASNEDAVFIWQDRARAAGLFAVADGMGGCQNGDLASRAVVEGLAEWLAQPGQAFAGIADFLFAAQAALQAVNDRILSTFGRWEPAGSTCVLLAVLGEAYGLFSVGDSRAYLGRGLRLTPLTRDDVWENQESVRQLYSERARRAHPDCGKLVQAVGLRKPLQGTLETGRLRWGDVLLLCSDGVYKPCPHRTLAAAAVSCSLRGPGCGAQQLRRAVYRCGAPDNLSLIFLRVR